MESDRRRPVRRSTLWVLLVIMGIGAALRFHHITEVEPFLADEAIYYLEARYLYSLLETARGSLARKAEEARTGQNLWRTEEEKKRFTEGLEGKSPWFARPGHLYLLCLLMAFLGPDQVAVGPVLSAISGTLCILLVFIVGRRLYGEVAGLLAAAFFSLSGVEVEYARTGLTEQDALVFFLLAVLFYLRSREAGRDRGWGSLALCGLFGGLSFVVHYRMVIFLFALFLLELPLWVRTRRDSIRTPARRAAVLVGSMLTPICLTELPYYMLMLFVHFFFKSTLPFQTYVEQLLGQAMFLVLTYLEAPSTGVRIANFLTYPFLLWKIEGSVACAALALSLLLALWARRREDALPAVLFLVPFLLCTLFNPRTRYLSGFLPFAQLILAASLQRLWAAARARQWTGGRGVVAGAVGLILIFGGACSLKALRSRVSYQKAIAFVERQGSPRHIASYAVVSQVYVGVKNVPSEWPSTEEELRGLYDQGYRYFIMDWVKDVIDVVLAQLHLAQKKEKFRAFQERIDLMNRIEQRTRPVYTCPNRHLDEISNAFEVNQNFWQTLAYYRRIQESQKVRTIRVYDLRDYFEQPLKDESRPSGPQ